MPSQQPPHVSPMYQPRPNLPLPPALSYNHQQLLAVTTVIAHVYTRPITTTHAPVVPVASVVPATRTVLLAPTALLSPFASSAVGVHHISTMHGTRVPIKLNDQVLTIPSISPSEPVSTASDKIMTATAQPNRVGNVDAKQVLSIVGSVLISQQMELSLLDGDELLEHFSTNSDDRQQQQHDISSDIETDVATTLGASTDTAASAVLELSNSTASVNLVDSQSKLFDAITSVPSYLGYVPLSTPAVCKPGQFVCEAHGLRPGFFACDSVGIPLPAVCGANEVCYQQGKSILCDAPGKNPQTAALSSN
ncbi:hypothetical protein LPJ66_007664 [Kickxella alabastrina]|uniref:Uncharacterized protein n=1 Tax=Kickxella alabastrina TaxID=61397 RepID=A0ACC1I9N2_9FUNG|nr:hypothetical protein LPJ66_007664 [Kickxella alabastrina]